MTQVCPVVAYSICVGFLAMSGMGRLPLSLVFFDCAFWFGVFFF